MKTKNKNKIDINLILLAISSLLFALPSVLFYIKNKTILNFEYEFKFLLSNIISRKVQGIVFLILLLTIIYFYIKVVKNRNKIFKTNKQILLFILVIGLIFMIIVPVASSDIFYYLGVGRINSNFNQNPYYTTIKQFVDTNNNIELLKNDKVLEQGYNNVWSDTTVVYGPIWTLICSIVSFLSFGNIDLGLFIFKLFNLIIHILNCILIYKITKKKIFVLIYGLNPFILFEGISCCHNDIYTVFFIMLAFYFLLKKKNILLSVIMLAISATIKYYSIIFLPFIIIYHFKDKNTKTRFIKCIQYGLIFVVIAAISYLPYIKDISVLNGISTMQNKITKNFYLILIATLKNPILVNKIKGILLITFIALYTIYCLKLLNMKEIKFSKIMKEANSFLVMFIFLLITNFQPWYMIWLYTTFMWQKKENIKLIVTATLFGELANVIFFMWSEHYTNGIYYSLLFYILVLGYIGINKILKNRKLTKMPNYVNIKIGKNKL